MILLPTPYQVKWSFNIHPYHLGWLAGRASWVEEHVGKKATTHEKWWVVTPNISDIDGWYPWIDYPTYGWRKMFPNKILPFHQLALQTLHTKQCGHCRFPWSMNSNERAMTARASFFQRAAELNVRINHYRTSGEPGVRLWPPYCIFCSRHQLIQSGNNHRSESPLLFLLEILNYHARFDSVHQKGVFTHVFVRYTSWLPRHCSHKILRHRAIPQCGIDSHNMTSGLGKRQTVPHMVQSMCLWHHGKQCPPLPKTDLSKLRVGTAKPFARLHHFFPAMETTENAVSMNALEC